MGVRARKHEVFGVLNGIDMADYNPATDARIPAEYTADDLSGKAKCKAELQEKLGLTVDPNVPIIGMVGRLSSQKGLDLVDYIIGDLMSENVQLVVLGMGESRYVNLFSWAEGEFKGKVAARFAMDHALAHQIYAGCDMFLMPSQFEPCGLSPADCPALRHSADCPRDGRSARHGAVLQRVHRRRQWLHVLQLQRQ